MRSQHHSKWSEYQLLNSIEERVAFFKSTEVPFVNTLHAHLVDNEPTLTVWINKTIVETIIGDMFFHPDDIENVTQTRALSIFKMVDEVNNGHKLYYAENKTN
ncbi:hypothetical protein BC833DRAFT_621868 [Globomyces pollinis-pini]|nr:hypothetical protein BC833DRAFT_621868 [Globomyces pollinis-pini]